MADILFSWLDYFLFIVMLVLSTMIGIYYGFFEKQSTANDYLLGGKKMSVWPVSMSLASSTISGLTFLALPGDVYKFGINYWLGVPTFALVLYVSYQVYLPVFYKLQLTSTYEYLKLRFDNRIRVLASVLFTFYNIVFLPIVIYAPALALSKVTNINMHFITPVLCGVCIFYTTLGGIKAVIWTDALQLFVMVGSIGIVFVVGIISAGGLVNIWNLNHQTGRLHIDFDLDFTKRDSFWTGTFGIFAMWLMGGGVSQGSVQKCLSLPSYKCIKIAMVAYYFAIFIMVSISAWSGFIMFAKYFDCDPLESGKVKSADELLPLYVMDVAQAIPGLAGLFVSGIFSAALSTLSASMNCLAATIYEDFLSSFMPKGITEERVSTILKFLVVSIGIFCTALVFVVEKLGNILPLALSFSSITNGPLLGLFTAGMLIPMVNATGALVGGICSLVIMGWITMTSQWYKTMGVIKYPSLPVFTHGCNMTLNDTISTMFVPNPPEVDEPFVLYKISFYYYTLMGFILVIVIGVGISFFSKGDSPVNRDCISPIAQRFIKAENLASYYSIKQAANTVVNHRE